MRIVAIHERTVPLVASERNANVSFDAMTGSAVVVVTDAVRNGVPLMGLAFDTIGRYGHGGLLRERFIPRVLAADPAEYSDGATIDPDRVWAIAMRNEKFGGHGERSGAVGLIDAALWDLAAKLRGEPLWHVLATKEGAARSGQVAVYASGGHYRPENDAALLADEVRSAIDAGHTRFKIKVGGLPPEGDRHRIETVLGLLAPGMTLAVDANGMFDIDSAGAFLAMAGDYPLAWIEEPASALDYDFNAQIAATTDLPIATGENLFSFDDARNLRRHGGLRSDRDIVQVDVLASYGIPEYRRILEDYAAHGWARDRFAPHAGHIYSMHLVAGFGLGMAEVAMSTTSLFGQITADIPIEAGRAQLPETLGAGFETLAVYDRLFGDMTS